MRRSPLFSLMLVTFTIFTFLGFRTANYTSKLSQSSQPIPDGTQNRRVIMIQVDSLDSPEPTLKSVWVGMMFQSQNQAVLSFLPIYPAAGGQPSEEALARSFHLDRTGKPGAAFWRRLAALDIQKDGFIVADDHALQEAAGWIKGQGNIYYGSPSQDKTAVPGEWFLELSCGSMSQSTGNIAQFGWQSLSDHLLTDMSFDELALEWKGLIASDQPLKCELVRE